MPLCKFPTPTLASGNPPAAQPGKPIGLLGLPAVQTLDFWCSRALQNKSGFAEIYQKIKRLQVCREALKKSYLIDRERVIESEAEKKGNSIPGISAKMLLKTHVEKMSVFSFAMMLMKNKGLILFLP